MKNFKKIVAVILLSAMILSAIGCYQNASSIEEPEPPEAPMTAFYPYVTTEEPANVGQTLAPPTTAPTGNNSLWTDNPWEDLATTDSKQEGIFWIRSEDIEKRYRISRSVPYVPNKKYSVGRIDRAEENVYLYDVLSHGRGILTCGDVWIPLLEEDDLLIGVSSQSVPDLFLAPLNFYGYGVGLFYSHTTDEMILFCGSTEREWEGKEISKITDFQVTDSLGNPLEDWNEAIFNEEYTASWYEGTIYHEEIMVADNSFFVYADGNILREEDIARSPYSIRLKGQLTKNGYATYDFSNVPSGVYQVYTDSAYPPYGFGLIEIS